MNFLEILDRPIAYHRIFVRFTGSVTGAVLLSQAMYWQARSKHDGGWWWKTQSEWQEETGLTRRELDTAKLACKKFLESQVRGIPATTWYRVNEGALIGALSEGLPGLPEQTSLAESAKLDCTKAPNLNGGKRQTIRSESTTETTTKSKKGSNFVPPSLEEVKAYCKEIGISDSDAEVFFDGKQANGWYNGQRKMVCWKSTLRVWKGSGWLASQKQAQRSPSGYSRPQEKSLAQKLCDEAIAKTEAAVNWVHPDDR